MVVTVDTTPATSGALPTNGQVYSSDASVDANLFAGDKLGTAMIVGAFYQDRTTTFVDVTGLMANTPYYVSGYPVDCQLRYMVEGVHAYSQNYTNRGSDGTNGTQVLVLNSSASAMGVQPTDSTGLNVGQEYSFQVQVGLVPKPNRPVDSVECTVTPHVYTITVDGTDGQSYSELVDAINKQFALLSNGALGATPPNTGAYYWNAPHQKLFQWNGTTHVELPVIIDQTAPNIVSTNTYWLNPTTGELSIWNGSAWAAVQVITFATDPTSPIADKTYWFNGMQAFLWNGTAWCVVSNVTQPTDPSLPITPPAGSYWYDTADGATFKWNSTLEMWSSVPVIHYNQDPNTLPVGTFWLNDVAGLLYQLNTPSVGWNLQPNLAITETEPATPAPGKFWYNPTTKVLKQRSMDNLTWNIEPVIVFSLDPVPRSGCDLWYDTSTNQLKLYDALAELWVVVSSVYMQDTDPTATPVIAQGATWYDTDTNVFYVYGGSCFVATPYISWPSDPTQLAQGVVWHNITTDTRYVRGPAAWAQITPVVTTNDPTSLPTGTFWYTPSTLALKSWNGVTWVSVTYSLLPLTPTKGTLWFDTTTNLLKSWNGYAWVLATPVATVELDCHGNMLFTDTNVGSASFISLADISLFGALNVTNTIHDANPGTDGASSTPSYAELGIGTDGSDAARDAIANDIRYELGYPVQDVELTKEQMDYAINKALSELRQRSGLPYKRGFFFMALKANEQRYFLTNKISGMNKIVDVMGVYRCTSAFLASAHGAGVYGQIVVQHLYNMGTFDLLSYHMMADYTKMMEILFAARVTYTWNEQTREIWLHQRYNQAEPMVMIDATVERTEQDIMTDRYAKPWIRRYAAGVARIMLAEIRGKFSTLPGASGSVTLNAAELRQTGQAEIEACLAEIDDYLVDKPEEFGMGTTFTFG
jgi:hypothetical protein